MVFQPFSGFGWPAVLLVTGQYTLLNMSLASAQKSSEPQITSPGNPAPPSGSGQDHATETETCGITPPSCTNNSRYRSIDGSCNNLLRPTWGVPQTSYGRLLPNNFADGTSAWPVAKSGRDLPNSREISLRLFPSKHRLDRTWNLNTQQWGQIVAHDMSLVGGVSRTAKNRPTCCDGNRHIASDINNPKCAPIMIPENDPVHASQGSQCLNMVRAETSMSRECTPPNATAEAITQVTAYMDLSLVYGNSDQENAQLRAGSGGRLKTVIRDGREWPPQHPNLTLTCGFSGPKEPCYLTGDRRVNQNPQLAVLQIVLLHEHNRIANALATLNPHWDDEILFQEARRIHIAEFQHINYNEYLPILLGYDNMVKNKLIYPGAQGYVNDYNHNVDPSVLAEHAAGAYRHFHTNICGNLTLILKNRARNGTVRMTDWINRPSVLELNNSFENLARGLTVQEQDFTDQFWDSDMTTYIFKRNLTYGNDLRAIDIQRARDQGLGSYVATRAACGLSVPSTFEDMANNIAQKNVKILQSLYETPEDVDLIVAGSLERNVPGTLAGPTFLCILTKQFYKTRVGDRYFYENGNDPVTAFTSSQLNSIRRASVARLFCDNVKGISKMQPKAFKQISHSNELAPCGNLPFVDLSLWQEARKTSKK